MSQEYVHQLLNQEATAIGGHYVLVKEARLSFRRKEVLYLVGHAAFDTTCCGVGGCAYALVPGFILEWKVNTDDDGLAVSLIEQVQDKAIQRDIQRLLRKKEIVQQVRFQ